jgi:pimeloyl-ACP methyl ester carboxylesterase
MGTVTSADGTAISYLSTGTGPGLLLVPAALTVAADLAALAAELGRHFTVHTVERRGRGASGPQGSGYGIATECADLRTVQAHTGAAYLVGHSYGGLVALEYARASNAIGGVVVYEPGVSVDGSVPVDWIPACERELAAGRSADAFITFIRGVNPRATGRVPRLALKAMVPLLVRGRRDKYALMPTTIAEHREVGRLAGTYGNYREIAARTLVMVGQRSLRTGPVAGTVAALAAVLPNGEVCTMPRMDHFGPKSHPVAVAAVIAEFLTRSTVSRS